MDEEENSISIRTIDVSNHCAEGALTDLLGLSLQLLITTIAFMCLIQAIVGIFTWLCFLLSISDNYDVLDFIHKDAYLKDPHSGLYDMSVPQQHKMKRFCESTLERRSWKIWFYDTSKQAMGATTMHLSNVFLASQYDGNPCTWYIMNFLLDSSVGLTMIIAGIRFAQHLAIKKQWLLINFGEYGNPPMRKVWLIQCGLYICLILFVKVIVSLLLLLPFWDAVQLFIHSIITNELLEIVLDVVVIPFFVNAFIFWVTDEFLKKHQHVSSANLTSTPQAATVV